LLLDNFPKDKNPRDGQIQILKELDIVINSGYKKIIISAPTGIGKSYIAKTIANSKDTSFIVTSTKQLQDQYIKDFPIVKSIKGMGNFACYQLMDLEKLDDVKKAIQNKLTCDKGQCTARQRGKPVNSCNYKSKKDGDSDEKQCIYYKQKAEGLESPQTILNYALYFQLKKFQTSSHGVLRDVGIFDEAHAIENEIVRFLGLDIWAGYLSDVGIAPSRYKLDDISEIIRLLDDLREGYGKILMGMEAGSLQPKNSHDAQNYSRLLKRFDRVIDVRTMIDSDRENFVIQTPENDTGGNFRKVSIVPIEISGFAGDYFDSELQIFLSATIDNENFSKNLGMGDCGFIDMSRSPFPKDNRRIEFLNIRQLRQSSPIEDRIEVINQMEKLLKKHQTERGLILTSSKKRCFEILKYLSKEQRMRIQIAHSENEDGSTIEEILESHKNTSNGILLSSSLWQGIDLKDDLSRFQIIEKCPYLYLGDKRVMIKKEKDQNWYRYQTTMKLLQGFGRSIRSEKDYAVTYVLDGSVQNLLLYNKRMVPIAYHDIIYD